MQSVECTPLIVSGDQPECQPRTGMLLASVLGRAQSDKLRGMHVVECIRQCGTGLP